jgi:hypothetical protein
MRQAFGDAAVSPYVRAIYEARRGLGDQAIATLHRALDAHDPNGVMIGTDVSLEPLHGHDAWPGLLRRSREPLSA